MLSKAASMRQRGFSIVEVMVTITVLALMLFIAMPSIATWLANTRIRNTAESLQSGLQMARSEAVRRNQSISFYLVSLTNPAVMDDSCTLSDTSGSWVISASLPTKKCSSAPSTTTAPMIVSTRAIGGDGANVAVTALQSDKSKAGNTVTFNGFGRVTNTNTAIGSIDIAGPAEVDEANPRYRKLQLLVTPAGAVRMCDPSANLPDNDPRKC